MEHVFSPEEEELALRLLEMLSTAHEAAGLLLAQLAAEDWRQFAELTELLDQTLTAVEGASAPYREKLDSIWLPLTCRCARSTLRTMLAAGQADAARCRGKLEFELIPVLAEAYAQFYFWAYVYTYPEREKKYYDEELCELFSNPYTNAALKDGTFRYEVAFSVLAYNHLDYTKLCVESLLENIPEGLSYELILRDNGSTDGTLEYFESIRPAKVFHNDINHAFGCAAIRAVEAKYLVGICNDVIVTPGAIENLLDCIRSRNDIAWAVPTTPNVSNLQTIPVQYASFEEMRQFARRNNVRDPYRWEQRTRLCNPIDVRNMLLCNSRQGICNEGYLARDVNMFPDDRFSLLCRRAGYRLMLCKDAFCHHFGSVTIKEEQKGKQNYYEEGRRAFHARFGVDPWGTGFCYDPAFLERIVGEHTGHVEVLGVSCGMGSNSLRIKEQIKEFCHNTDCLLTNITDDSGFLADSRGVSDKAELIRTIKELKATLRGRAWDYIVWDDPFLMQYKFGTLLALFAEHLTEGGSLLLKRTQQSATRWDSAGLGAKKPGGDWALLNRADLKK